VAGSLHGVAGSLHAAAVAEPEHWSFRDREFSSGLVLRSGHVTVG
jgi:hypothetical protein